MKEDWGVPLDYDEYLRKLHLQYDVRPMVNPQISIHTGLPPAHLRVKETEPEIEEEPWQDYDYQYDDPSDDYYDYEEEYMPSNPSFSINGNKKRHERF